MKAFKFASICAVAGLALASCAQMTSNEKQPAGIAKSEVDSVSYMLGYSLGMQISQSNMGALNLTEINKGVKDAISGDAEVTQEMFYNTVNGFLEKRSEIVALQNLEKEQKFFAENAKKDGVKTTESGVQYKVIREGNGVKPAAADTVEVNYEGRFLDGKVFDSSYERGEAAIFPLNRVIPGWTEGLSYADEGSEIIIWIPSELGYGASGNGLIGPNETLEFKVELIKVMPFVEEDNNE